MNKKYKINDNFFENINTENQAYWLGFIMADGCVTYLPRIRLRMVTAKQDRLHLKKFLLDTKGTQKIYYNKCNNSYNLDISSKKMVDDLVKLGVVPRKTFKEKVSPINKILLRHFIRGYFDGDGCFKIYQRKNRKMFSMCFSISCGSMSCLKNIQNILVKNLKINKTKIRKANAIYELNHGGNKQTIKIMEWLYQDANIFLERKFNKYKHYFKKYKNNIRLANQRVWIKFNCDYCNKENKQKRLHYNRMKRHFCNRICYAKFIKEKLNFWETNAYKGVRKKGQSKRVYQENYHKNIIKIKKYNENNI